MPEERITKETWYRDIKGDWYKITGIEHESEVNSFWPSKRGVKKRTKVHFIREDMIVSYFIGAGHLTKAEVEKMCVETETEYLKEVGK